MKFPIFTTFALLSAFTWIYMKATRKKESAMYDSFWEKENLANSTRKQSLDSLSYISIPLEALPFQETAENEVLLECQKIISSLSERKIVNLTGISNTDLKLQYGVANLTVLTEYDQNFTLLARTLHSWGSELFSLNKTDEAVIVLEFAVSCKTDIKGTYTLLTQIYRERLEFDKIEALIDTAENLNSLMKKPILTELKQNSIFSPSVHASK